jgi:hypothetical protein
MTHKERKFVGIPQALTLSRMEQRSQVAVRSDGFRNFQQDPVLLGEFFKVC